MRTVIFDLEHTLFDADQVVREGAHELLVILQRLGLTIAGLTNDDHRALVRLDEAGLRPYFTTVLCADHLPNPKMLAGIERLLGLVNAEREEVVLVSHAPVDILLARDAGLGKTIVVTHGPATARHRRARADHLVPDLATVLDVVS